MARFTRAIFLLGIYCMHPRKILTSLQLRHLDHRERSPASICFSCHGSCLTNYFAQLIKQTCDPTGIENIFSGCV